MSWAWLNIPPEQLMRLELREYNAIAREKNKQLKNEREFEVNNIRLLCEVIRLQTLKLFNATVGQRKYQKRRPQQMFKFDWDTKRGKERPTKEQMVKKMKYIAKFFGALHELREKRKQKQLRAKQKGLRLTNGRNIR